MDSTKLKTLIAGLEVDLTAKQNELDVVEGERGGVALDAVLGDESALNSRGVLGRRAAVLRAELADISDGLQQARERLIQAQAQELAAEQAARRGRATIAAGEVVEVAAEVDKAAAELAARIERFRNSAAALLLDADSSDWHSVQRLLATVTVQRCIAASLPELAPRIWSGNGAPSLEEFARGSVGHYLPAPAAEPDEHVQHAA